MELSDIKVAFEKSKKFLEKNKPELVADMEEILKDKLMKIIPIGDEIKKTKKMKRRK